MIKTEHIGVTAMVVLVITLFVTPATAQTCDITSDAQIVSGIYDRIRADRVLAPQIPHINVVAAYYDSNEKTFAVKFQGWADNLKDYDKIRGFGMSAACVRSVNVNLFLESPPDAGSGFRSAGGCASGTKPCGDVCIPSGDPCNITVLAGWLRPVLSEDFFGLTIGRDRLGCNL